MSAEMNNFNREIELLKKLKEARILDQGRKEQLKQNILARASNLEPLAVLTTVRSTAVRKQRFFAVMRYALTAAAGISVVAGTAFASNSAKPGDTLFPVKKLKENIQISLTMNDQAKAELEAKIAQDRLNSLIEIKNHSGNRNNQAPQPSPAPVQTPTGSQDLNQNSAQPEVQSNSQGEEKPQLEQEATDELTQAVEHLRRTQAKLRQKGNTQAAAAIDNTILELQQKAQINLGANNGDDGKNSDKNGGQKDSHESDQDNHGGQNSTNNSGSAGTGTTSGTRKHRSSRDSSEKDKTELGPISPEPQIPPSTAPQSAPQQQPEDNTVSPQTNTESSKIESGVLISTPAPAQTSTDSNTTAGQQQNGDSGSQNSSGSNSGSGSDSGK